MKKLVDIGLVIGLTLGVVQVAVAEPRGTFRQAYEYGAGDKSNLDPISEGRIPQVIEKIMNRLVRPGLDGKPSPDLAVSWSASPDATEWTFKLREGVRFHDGSNFEAADVVYSLERVLDPEADSPTRAAIQMIESVVAVDDMTVKMVLNTPYADMPLQLMDYRLRMLAEGSG